MKREELTFKIWHSQPLVDRAMYGHNEKRRIITCSCIVIRIHFGTGLLERVGTGIVGTIGYVVLPTGVSTDVSRDIV